LPLTSCPLLKRLWTSTLSCMVDRPLGETELSTLHAAHCQAMDSTALLDYLMNSVVYLRTDDLDGWKKTFSPPPPPPPPPPQKRLRQSPATAPYIPLDLCVACKSEEVIEDVRQGQVVCTSCGLIQLQGVFTGGAAHCSWDMLKNATRVSIHRYSRVVHFLNVVRLLQADSSPTIPADLICRLRAAIDGPITDVSVNKALRLLGLARKYRRHRWRFVVVLGGVCPYKWKAGAVKLMAKMFRVVEFHWGRKKKRVFPDRKVFFSYTFLLYQFLKELGLPACSSFLLKSPVLRERQYQSYSAMCAYTGYTCHE